MSALVKFVAATIAAAALFGGAAAQCDAETSKQFCYTADNGGTPQNVNTTDVAYVAAYLRAYGAQTKAGRQLTMTVADAADCAEWSLYTHGTVLATAKHIDSTLNSSVLYADIANTIDGGAGATPAQQAAAILGCGTAGGSLGVVYDPTNPQYNTATYLADDYTPGGILIKIVSSS
ncbi:hypothetical protein SPI_07953 [Niveomyces insectorum RCEF 264]|uniref:Uncharacterized protein n=1 Tax=Niveomyces insectorum RCEF 264 TaxID=1081102 RepID=A0A167P6I2_9HYPO|nr:hypothetical protein SPI_07953 [Niveomyces insectorum RCEF 264]